MVAKCADTEKAEAYLKSYADELVKTGYVPVYVYGDSEEGIDYYKSPEGSKSFRYRVNEDGTVGMLFKSEKLVEPSEVISEAKKAGFPEMDLSHVDIIREHAKFYKVRNGLDHEHMYTFALLYDTQQEAEHYLDVFVEKLEKAGFDKVSPQEAGTLKTIAYMNEKKGLTFAFDFIPGENQTGIYAEVIIEK